MPVRIGEEVTEEIDIIPAKLIRRRTVRPKYAYPCGDAGVAIDIQGQTKDVRMVRNTLRETREPAQRTGIRIAAAVGRVDMTDNVIEGFATPVADGRSGE